MDTTAAATAIAAAITSSLDQVADTAATDALHDAITALEQLAAEYRTAPDFNGDCDVDVSYLDGIGDAIKTVRELL